MKQSLTNAEREVEELMCILGSTAEGKRRKKSKLLCDDLKEKSLNYFMFYNQVPDKY